MIIYKITNLINNKIYIGQTNNKRDRYFGGGKLLRQAILKYGKNNFKKEMLIDNINSQEELDNLEIEMIKKYDSTNKDIGYNILIGGLGSRNVIFTDERKQYLSKILKKKYSSDLELKERHLKATINGFTKERSEKISKALRERIIKDSTREKLKKASFGRGSKGEVLVYENNMLIHKFVSLEQCSKNLKISVNTIRPKLNTEITYKNMKFKRLSK